ncbi:hypothetical protein GSI_02234 [Ganoderma sinense ZZ0214-1]|uniref:Uncharacterized protein n=1 Tax=Ganoderma sinense ZZ0214-1 TaxID=1077348 RepID=A0A2G8SNZ9_9APHY|nr:hypothetical protein GSI_02234 [Ganoderma sinense ZZ0214-1]
MITPLSEPPVAEVSLRIKSTSVKNSATWETQGIGSRPLRVSNTHYHHPRLPDVILARTKEVLAIFAPGTAVTSLTITSGRSLRPEDFWTGILAALPHLTRLVVAAGRAGDYPRILPLLGKPQEDGGCLCPSLSDLSVLWDPENDPIVWTGLVTRRLQTTGLASVGVEPGDEPWTVAAGARAYCRVLHNCLRSRSEHGCLPLRALSVFIWDRGYEAAEEAGLREGLKDLVEEVSVGFQSEQGW